MVEKELAGIWASFLKVSAVGVHDNFFDLGGHSLLATQVVSRMRKEFQLEIPLRSLFESPTVAQLAEKIEEANSNEAERFLNEIEALSEEDARQLLGQERHDLRLNERHGRSMDELNKRISSLSPAKRALLELRLKESGARLTTGDDYHRGPIAVRRRRRFLSSVCGFSTSLS